MREGRRDPYKVVVNGCRRSMGKRSRQDPAFPQSRVETLARHVRGV